MEKYDEESSLLPLCFISFIHTTHNRYDDVDDALSSLLHTSTLIRLSLMATKRILFRHHPCHYEMRMELNKEIKRRERSITSEKHQVNGPSKIYLYFFFLVNLLHSSKSSREVAVCMDLEKSGFSTLRGGRKKRKKREVKDEDGRTFCYIIE